METFYRSIPEFIVKTDDITNLSNRACDNLKLGDEVILVNGDAQKKYVITSKSLDKMTMIFFSSEATVEVIYQKADNVWSYEETKESGEIPPETLVDIEKFLSGEMPNDDVLSLIQKNGIAFDKQYIFVDGEVQVVDDIPEDYTGMSYYFSSEEASIFFEYYENAELIKSCEAGVFNIKLNGISFSQKATVWVTGEDIDTLEEWLLENNSKIKVGDYLDCNGRISLITMSGSSFIRLQIVLFNINCEVEYRYSSQDEEWSLYSSTETPIGGTKLYKHDIECSDGNETWHFSFISFLETQLSLATDSSNVVGENVQSISYELGSEVWGVLPRELAVLNGELIIRISNVQFYSMTPTSLTDTVTPL